MSIDKQIITDTENKSNNFEDKSNKQIEEMAKTSCLCYANGICECDEKPCDLECGEPKVMERLYNAGYRKASEVAREIFEEIEEGVKAAVSALQFENNPIHRQVKHETYSRLMRFIKTVEQKYT